MRNEVRAQLRWASIVCLLVTIACVATLSRLPEARRHRTSPVEGATQFVGAEKCETCHAEVQGRPAGTSYHADCESCHGSGELHIASMNAADIRYPANADCSGCHETGRRTLLGWSSSEHNRSGVLCSDCHAPHSIEPFALRVADVRGRAGLPNAGTSSRLCAECHPDVSASFQLPSHHPVREGLLECTDCHAPHASDRLGLGSPTRRCSTCHQDVSGPWVFEHGPVTEDCTYCHAPHGASSRALLDTNEPGVCISCHSVAEAGAVHDPWAFTTRCSDCHSAVHGSYADPHLRR